MTNNFLKVTRNNGNCGGKCSYLIFLIFKHKHLEFWTGPRGFRVEKQNVFVIFSLKNSSITDKIRLMSLQFNFFNENLNTFSYLVLVYRQMVRPDQLLRVKHSRRCKIKMAKCKILWYPLNVSNLILYFTYRHNILNSLLNILLLMQHGDVEPNPGPAKGPSGKLLIGSYNISGCKKYAKLRRIIAWIFMHKKSDRFIFSLQETYLTKNDVSKVEMLWREGLVLSPSTGRARGVVTFFSNSLFDSVIFTYGSPDGRITVVVGEYNSNIDMFVSIYSPNSGKNAEFYTSFFAKINGWALKYKVDNIFISGDFNLVLLESPGNRPQSSYEKKLSRIVMDEMEALGLKCVNDKTKHTWNRGKILSTLDYIFTPVHIADTSPVFNVRFGIDHSDHGLIQTTISYDLDKGRGMFRPNLAFLDCVDHRSLFEAELFMALNNSNSEWDPHMKLEYAKVMIRSKAAEFSIKYNKKTDDKHKLVVNEINKLQSLKQELLANDKHPLSNVISMEQVEADLFSLNTELDKVLNAKTKLLSSRSRIRWLEFGEKSNKYFLNLNKSFQNNSYYKSFLRNDTEVFDSREKVQTVYDFYSSLYNLQPNSDPTSFLDDIEVSVISETDNDSLKAPLTKSELVKILKSCGDTASGPDGISYRMLKTCWSFYGDLLINSWNYAISTGILAPSHRESVICLLSKKGKDKRLIGNLRPITLSNCDIKIITKAMTKRCNNILNSILSPHQTAYVPGRIVHDNLRTIDMVKDFCKKRGVEGYLVSLDAKKAFDSVDHNFIDLVLLKFGFCYEFRNLVKILYNSIASRVLINGHLTDEFPILRSVKQGDALSCVLFILCMETIVKTIECDPKVTNIVLDNVRIPKVYAYADDIAILVANKSSIECCINNYYRFSSVSGLYLNVDKTEVLDLCKATPEGEITISSPSGHTIIKPSTEITICGKAFSLSDDTEHKKNVTAKINNLGKALSNWNKRSLSIFGRNIILKTFGLSQVIYSMQNSSFENSDLSLIEKSCFDFLWNKKHNKTKAYERIARVKLKNDYCAGGINATDVYSMHKALALRQIIRTSSPLCKHVINSLQVDLCNFKPDLLFQNSSNTHGNKFINCAISTLGEIGDIVINEILSSNEESRISKHYYSLIASERLDLLLARFFKNSIINNYAKRIKKSLGVTYVGQLINEYKYPSTDSFKIIVSSIVNSHKLFKILASRNELSYGVSYRDLFPIRTNNFISSEKVTTRSLRMLLWNKGALPTKLDIFNVIRKIIHPREREVMFFELHDVCLSNKKLFEMKLRDTPYCDICNEVQSTEHIFTQCSNAIVAYTAYNELLPQFKDHSQLVMNIMSLIKRLLFLNKNNRLVSNIFRIAILDRINDFTKIQCHNIKRKELAIINMITLA